MPSTITGLLRRSALVAVACGVMVGSVQAASALWFEDMPLSSAGGGGGFSVPEPALFALLMLAGIVGLCATMRRPNPTDGDSAE